MTKFSFHGIVIMTLQLIADVMTEFRSPHSGPLDPINFKEIRRETTTQPFSEDTEPPQAATTVTDPSDVRSMKLRRVKEQCYKGGSSQKLTSQVTHFPDCCSFCMADARCQGVNYYSAGGTCVMVQEDVMEGSVNLDEEVGCQFWTVVWKK